MSVEPMDVSVGEIRISDTKTTPDEEKPEKDSLPLWQNIYFALVWMLVTSIFIWFLVQIAQQYQESNSSPATIITFSSVAEDILPMVTICNWNNILPGNVEQDYNRLTIEGCTNYAAPANSSQADCTNLLTYMQINSTNDQGVNMGVFDCFRFNNDSTHPLTSQYTGYSGSYSVLFSVANPPVEDDLRIGLQVSLTEVGVEPNVYGEDKFAPPGFDTYYATQAIVTVFNNYSTPISHKNFTSTSSMTALTRKNNDTISYVSVSFAFQTLNEQTITYDPQYTINNFFGDFAGMVGTLMGLDAVKVAAGILVGWEAIRQRNIFPLQEHFNG